MIKLIINTNKLRGSWKLWTLHGYVAYAGLQLTVLGPIAHITARFRESIAEWSYVGVVGLELMVLVAN